MLLCMPSIKLMFRVPKIFGGPGPSVPMPVSTMVLFPLYFFFSVVKIVIMREKLAVELRVRGNETFNTVFRLFH